MAQFVQIAMRLNLNALLILNTQMAKNKLNGVNLTILVSK